ncbi:nucleolar pre-ribosomal-associated protein 1 isoform X1 [Pygocentrus nattereri]|uniref:Nucleolar pre-ribosomal-associated protein 1 C-terminal domain-containing protein n=1 Tax=Pygocentrus nattereri TaxID=42514 RepID=A0A3B4CQ28_PYGNA|nr:nucleolar pre-ribosomal-associated protein 1 isoform X1 [Pygocentrus nattereri]
MAKKRQNAEPLESLMPANKKKTTESEFNGTVFKSMLKDPSSAFKGLEIFIRTAKKLPCANLYDVVEGYIKISAECSEILLLLEGDTHSETELMLIFQSLEMIFLRTASDLSHFTMVGSTVVKKIVSTHMKLLQSSLCSVNRQFVQQCLRLLAAMVSQGADSAREIFSSLVYTKTLSSLARIRDKTGRPDVRMAYIQFVLSFMMCGDSSLVGHILDTKDFLTEILNTGLKEDRISIVSLILATLKTKVVHNTAISKSQKVRFFSASTLAQIASLYRWNGILDTTTFHSQEVTQQEGGRLLVRDLVHNFLLDVCCSHKYGISFHDPSLGTAMRAGNIVLLQFVVGLKQAAEDDLLAELLVSILKCNPDILPRYFKETHFSFTPRMKGAWLDSIALLKKIYQAQPEVSQAFQLQEMLPVPRLLSMVLVTSLPPVCNKTFFTQGLKLPSVVGQQVTLSVLVFILRRAQKNIEYSLKRPVWDGSDSHSPTSMEEFVQLYREALSKVLPDVISIVSMWQSLSKKEKEEGEENTGATGSKAPDEVKTEEYGEQDPALIQFKALLLQVLRLYHSVVPHFISQSKFDFSKLLQGIVSVKEMRNEVPPVLQYQILQLALELPASKFSWFRFQDGVNPGPARGEVSVFYQLLKMFISSSSSSHLRTSTRKLVLKVLKDSGVFEHTWRELELWVDHLLPLEPSQQEEAIQFLDQVLMKVVCNPYEYMDKVVAMVQETVCLQAEMSGQNRGTGTLPNSEPSYTVAHNIDKLGVFADMEDRGKGTEKTGSSLTDVLQTFPFSALVPAVLEARNKLLVNVRDEKAVLCEYMCAALCDILHSQRDPLTLCLTLQHYDKELLSAENSRPPHSCLTSFCLYYSQWLPQKPEETWLSHCIAAAPPAVCFPAFLKMCYSEGPDAFLRDSFKSALERSMSTLQLSQFTGAVTQVLLYLKSFVDAFSMLPKGQAAEVVGCVLEVLGAVLHNLHSTAETTPNQSEPQSEPQELSLEMDSACAQEVNKEQVLLFVFNSVFTHPVLQQWFLAVELDVVPHHSLEVDRVRQLCVQLTQGVLNLLLSFAETVKALNALELISPYLSAAHQAMLKELQHSGRCLNEESQSVKAFLALYDYMEPSSVNEVLSALLLLPQSSLLADGDKLSLYGHAVLKVLTKSSAPPGKINTLYLSSENLRSLATLYTSCHSAQLENVLLQVLQREPWNAKLVPTDVLLHCLQQCSNLDLAALLVQNCSTHCLSFELWCLEQSDLADITAKNNSFLCLLTSYIRQAVTLDPCRPKDIQNTVLQMLTKTFLTELLSSALQMEAGVSLDQRMEILSSLIQLGDMAPELYQLISDLPANLKKPENYERWQLADSITEKLANTPEELHWRESLLTAALHWLSTTYKEQKTPQFTKEEVMLKRLKTLLISPENLKAVDWNVFVKSGLKYRYQDQRFLVTFNTLLELVYKNVNASKELLAIEALHMMVTSHSLFLPTMLSSQNETDSIPECKEALVSLLLTLVKKCPEVCNSNHFPVLLAAYGATLNPTDQKLLLLLQEYEKKNISLVEFQCLLWGPAAMNYQKTRKCLGPSLWQQPSSEQLLAQLAADRMLNTVALFPLHRRLVPQEGEEVICTEETKVTPDKLCLYDPCFLLPLFSFILRPESVVDCQKFVSCHALGVTVVALSSYDHKMRSAAYHVLCSFYEHLEGAHFREKKQLLYLLDTVKNGIQKQNLKVPFVHTTYIAKVAQQILRPEDHLYPVINRFLLGTQCVDLNRVPDFFRLFYSFDLEHKLERDWMLNVLEEGMMDRLSFNLCEQQSIYHTLLGFCSSPLCDQHIQIQIMNILRKSAHVIRAAYDLTKAHGVLTWIIQITEKRCLNGKLLSAVIGLLHSLWFTNLGEKESSRLGVQSTRAADQQGDGSAKCFPLPIISDYLYALLSVIRHLRSGVEIKELQWFLQTLGSVLRHQKMSLGAYEDAGWLTMHPHNLSCTAVLRLIHCWGTLTHDKALLFDLHDLAYKHSIRGLLETDKEKIRGKVSSKPSQSCLEHLCDVADGPLDECKSMLMNILTNWEPWHVLPNPNLRSSDFPDSSSLICATAHNILKWILKTLSEMSYDQSNTCTVLKWLQSVLLSYKTIADSLLSNEAMRVHLLRLYHQTCEHRLHEKSISKLDAVELFTSIMMHLLEVERSSEALHKSMIKACLHTTTDEGPKREAGLKLLSLYIHELWSGAKVPQLLLTHAKLVTRDRKKSQKSSKSPVVHLCKDILSALDSVFIT